MTDTAPLIAAATAVIRRHGAAAGAPSPPESPAGSGFAQLLTGIVSEWEKAPLVRIVGGRGTGRARLAAALERAATVRCEVVDADGPLPRTVPDIEVFTWCTAPCRHEIRWLRRRRRHPAIVVATRADTWAGGRRPEWAEGLVALGECAPGRPGFDHLCRLVDDAAAEVPALRVALATMRLERECDALGARDDAEALCAELCALAHAVPAAPPAPATGTSTPSTTSPTPTPSPTSPTPTPPRRGAA